MSKPLGQLRKELANREKVRENKRYKIRDKKTEERSKIACAIRRKVKRVKKEIQYAEEGGIVSDRIKQIADRFARGKLDLSKENQSKLLEDIVKQSTLEDYKITPKRTIQEMVFIALSNIADYVDWDKSGRMVMKSKDELTREQTSAIKEINTRRDANGNFYVAKLKFHPKIEAIRDLMKHFGLFEKDNLQKAPTLDLEKVIASLPPSMEDLVRTKLIKELSKYESQESESESEFAGMGLFGERQNTIN